MPRVRDFRPATLAAQASPKLQVDWKPTIGFEGRVWQFLIFLPRWFLTSEGRTMICTAEDEALLEDLPLTQGKRAPNNSGLLAFFLLPYGLFRVDCKMKNQSPFVTGAALLRLFP